MPVLGRWNEDDDDDGGGCGLQVLQPNVWRYESSESNSSASSISGYLDCVRWW